MKTVGLLRWQDCRLTFLLTKCPHVFSFCVNNEPSFMKGKLKAHIYSHSEWEVGSGGSWGRVQGSRSEDQQEGAGQQDVQQPQAPLQLGLLASHIIPQLAAHMSPAHVDAHQCGLLFFLLDGMGADPICCGHAGPDPASPRPLSPVPHSCHVPWLVPRPAGGAASFPRPPAGHGLVPAPG